MFDWITSVPPVMEFVILLAAFVAAFFALKKTVYLPVKKHFDRVNSGMDTLLGYPAVMDPGSGREIQAKTPPLAQRVYDLEKNGSDVSAALVTIANNQKHLLALQVAMDERKTIGEAIIKEWTDWRVAHEAQALARDERLKDWQTWRADMESRMIDVQVGHAQHTPHEDGDPHRP